MSGPEFHQAADWIELFLKWVPGPIESLIKNSRTRFFHPFDTQLSEATQVALGFIGSIQNYSRRPKAPGAQLHCNTTRFVATKISWLESSGRKTNTIHAKALSRKEEER